MGISKSETVMCAQAYFQILGLWAAYTRVEFSSPACYFCWETQVLLSQGHSVYWNHPLEKGAHLSW